MLLRINMKKEVFSFLILLVICTCVAAQEKSLAKPQILYNLSLRGGQSGHIEIIQPERLEMLLKMQIANNRSQEGIPGYRIRIFSQSGHNARQRSDDIRKSFMRAFPEINAYQEYNSPNFQITVGDFRTKNDALREKKIIERIYPGAFIVSDIIDISK